MTTRHLVSTKAPEYQGTFIYVLIHPGTRAVVYVGKTTRAPKWRLASHISSREKSAVARWKNALLAAGAKPIMEIVETVAAGVDWGERERYWIEEYRSRGAELLNTAPGGDGRPLGPLGHLF
jgi:hypothetical protein